MMRGANRLLWVGLVAWPLMGCDEVSRAFSAGCDDEISDLKKERGAPTRTTSFQGSGGYQSVTHWYGSTAHTFTSGGPVAGCDRSVFRG